MRRMMFRVWDGERMYYPVDGDMVFSSQNPRSIWLKSEKGWVNPYGDKVKVMQCTGVKDINGKDIYEGDVLSISKLYAGQFVSHLVTFRDGAFRCVSVPSEFIINTGYTSIREVSGNIYENPELIDSYGLDIDI